MRYKYILTLVIIFNTVWTSALCESFPTPVIHVTEQDVFDARLSHLSPSMQKYVHRLYYAFRDNGWKYAKPSRLVNYIMKTHKNAEGIFRDYSDPMSKKLAYELVYAITVDCKRWGLEKDWGISWLTDETMFDNIYGDKVVLIKKIIKHGKVRKVYAKNPPENWSAGYTQLKIDTATASLKSRGIDPTGLTLDDLMYFRLVNLDIGICILAAKIKTFGLVDGTKAYNAGDGSWQDGRSDEYYEKISEIYMNRAKWQ